MRKVLLFFGVVLFLFIGACSVSENEQPKINIDRLAYIDKLLEEESEAQNISGAVAIVGVGGDIVYHEAYGYADIESGRKMKKDDIFRIASMTKAITTVGIMMLYERGYFQLNDPISKYLPVFRNPKVADSYSQDGLVSSMRAAKSEITILHLLTHTSGITYPFIQQPLQKTYRNAGVPDGLTSEAILLEQGMQILAQQPLLFDPGINYAYGLNTDVLGYLIEVISGKSLDVFFNEEIFEPLGMIDTYFYLPGEKEKRLVTLYSEIDGVLTVSDGTEGDIKLGNPLYPIEGEKMYFSGGAGLSATARDYFIFLEMLRNHGSLDGVDILSRKSVELMSAGAVEFDWNRGSSFGLGFSVIEDLGKYGELGTLGSYSWGGAFNTSYWIDPSESVVAVLMSQSRPTSSDIGSKFQTAFYQALK